MSQDHVGVRVFSQGTDSYSMGLITQCVTLVNWLWWSKGGLDIGFSLCTVPAYYAMSEYFKQEAKVQDSKLRDVSKFKGRVPGNECRVVDRRVELQYSCFGFQLVCLNGMDDERVITIFQVGHILWLIYKMSNIYGWEGPLY